ncbi:hypothetical protein KUCAC02_005846 [Chaenocephalus aceratus]|uniref:Uncharacterized protein n=1 Tax=Chaenocephalus aceratus TaxID=36190 RepID=A0ACB9WQ42_CHAAC|nr:hypothetical protein KUCAC02_005846 [Chaenocephalus aceratus]
MMDIGFCTQTCTDALLQLAAVVDARSLRVALRDSIQELLPSTECVCVYLPEGYSRLLSDDPPHELPQEGKIRTIVDQLKRCQCAGLPLSELPEKYRICLAAPLPAHRRAIVIPLLNQERDKAITVLLVGCNPLSDQDELHLNMLEKHASVACARVQAIQKSHQKPPLSPSLLQSHNALLHLNVSDQDYSELDRNILQLCGELFDLDAASLQLKVINYLQEKTQSQCSCLLLVSEDNHQLFCQVVGDKVLEEEISFPLMCGRFGQVVEKKKSITLQDISAEERRQLSSMLGCDISSMLCVPVVSRATGQVVALACAFNKQNGQRHTEADEHAIQHCFCYTSTVLTSTLAFQKEQKLKVDCQALLQVAKNLFTHLDDVSVLLQEIVAEARNLSDAEICSVFLLDRVSHELVAKVFDGGVVSDEGEVIGVAELVNKMNGPWFNRFDEDLAMAFSIYCGISLAHSLLYKRVHEAQFRSHLANEMMMYHMKQSVLAALYSSEGSVMERHHFAQAIAILNTHGCNIFEKFNRKELIYKEFFSQGDLEKAMGNRPSEMMDREKAYIPELQISFMEHIAMPIYKLLSELFPEATELYMRVAANREQWTKVSHKFSVRGLPSNNSLDFLDQEYELLQSQGAFGSDDHCINGCLEEEEGGSGQ